MIFYLAYKILRALLRRPPQQTQVKGQNQGHPKLDLSAHDVEDVDFKEVKE
jgi:hypothetical protein